MKTVDFDYELPEELIAQTPIDPRDASRLLVVERTAGQLCHRQFRDLPAFLRPGDLLIANDSRVIPARLYGRKLPGGGRVELLLLSQREPQLWEALTRGTRIQSGTRIALDDTRGPDGAPHIARVVGVTETGGRLLEFDAPVESWLDRAGHMPLPPYIHEPLRDANRYQTIYAQPRGSVAAPTAGLHFTPALLEHLRAGGVEMDFVTLHVGLDTFRPVKEEEIEAHQIHTEHAQLAPALAERICAARQEGRRIIAVGTTSVRVLESAGRAAARAGRAEPVVPFSGPTNLYITPGFPYRVVDAMITNFHLPRSTLLMLVSAFAGRELILRAYQEAIAERYRFFSFGDAMLIL